MTYLGQDIPKLGFGLMRLPQLENGDFDIEQIKDMVDAFMDAGLTYFDTARAYTGSEDAIRQALVERYPRESYQLASKLPAWRAESAEEARAYFQESLDATGAGYFDFYLLHNLGQKRTKYFEDFDIWTYAQELKESGKIKHLGISFHDVASELEAILAAHPEIEFVQLQINYADWEGKNVQARRCYEVARAYDKPVIIMEPIKGGTLANPPEPVAEILKAANPDASIVSWALRYCWDIPGLITVLSGMSTIEQMQENIKIFKDYKPLTKEEREVIFEAQEKIDELIAVPCTACKYCMDKCPENINIAGIFEALNRASLYGVEPARITYGFETMHYGKASDCVQCGKCEDACPQGIPIISELETAVQRFEA